MRRDALKYKQNNLQTQSHIFRNLKTIVIILAEKCAFPNSFYSKFNIKRQIFFRKIK